MSGRLTELLADRPSALAFVGEQIGVVLVYDEEHGSNLTGQLEQALDELASRPLDRPATPRPHPPGVTHALELLNADLDRPSDRLALHLALKLHRMHAGALDARRGGLASP
jgi:hypothetical protein